MGRQGFAEEGADEGTLVIECVGRQGEGCDEKEKSENGARSLKKQGRNEKHGKRGE